MGSFAVSSMFFHEYTTPEIFRYVSRSGLDGIEYWLETPHFWLRDLPAGEVISCREQHPEIRTLTVHAPILDLNPCSINPDVAEVSIGYAVRSAAIAERLGASILTVHPGRRTAKRPPGEADYARFGRYLSALRTVATQNCLKICMENMEPAVNSFLCTPERVRQLLDDEPWLFFTLDVAHALAASDDEPFRYIGLCHDRLANVHISRKEGKRLHLPLDQNPLMVKVIHALKDARYTGPLTLEIDDLNLPHHLTADEKIAILSHDRAFMHECLR
ncbi:MULTISPECIES: sugar phosphate isomerase/epimerase [unclassified Methanoregula]|uniref:sugar phosphate isomerase/epimerase family protein n=1 Tax=unclassified Methanoregula TaxID=2649730 RepID=UPI0009CDB740|nr:MULTISPECIES: sugar phosphate isomerase/epimerase family protein [unclassified Methanoregula]OPX64475.1 MAG: endonuclease IV [Methanoregula sp. PtaB.Bin085]OPY35874.1 MAG: endonuclease IV [Methanoregula sp. PtaU1.Bin006]